MIAFQFMVSGRYPTYLLVTGVPTPTSTRASLPYSSQCTYTPGRVQYYYDLRVVGPLGIGPGAGTVPGRSPGLRPARPPWSWVAQNSDVHGNWERSILIFIAS